MEELGRLYVLRQILSVITHSKKVVIKCHPILTNVALCNSNLGQSCTAQAFSSVIPIAKRLNACGFFSPAQSNHCRMETNCHQTPTNFSQSNFNAFQMKHNRELLQSFPSAWKNKPYAVGFLILAQTKVNHCRLEKNLPQTPTSIRIRSFDVLSTINSMH